MEQIPLHVGVTPTQNCSYLPEQRERLAVVMDNHWHSTSGYEMLLSAGYRRSGNAIYKPMCELCHACTPLRIDATNFTPSKSQKRLQKTIADFDWVMKDTLDDRWFELYEKYIRIRHQNGSMFPANKEQFFEFSHSKWMNTQFLHIYQHGRLIAIAVTDVMPQSVSAMYTFFDPDIKLSIGTLCILVQLQYCQTKNKKWLYPGYQIDECHQMSYKVRFKPHQKLVNGGWQG